MWERRSSRACSSAFPFVWSGGNKSPKSGAVEFPAGGCACFGAFPWAWAKRTGSDGKAAFSRGTGADSGIDIPEEKSSCTARETARWSDPSAALGEAVCALDKSGVSNRPSPPSTTIFLRIIDISSRRNWWDIGFSLNAAHDFFSVEVARYHQLQSHFIRGTG